MLYLKGAQGRRFISDQSRKKDPSDRPPPERRSPNPQLLTLPEAAALLLTSLQKPQEEQLFLRLLFWQLLLPALC
ncbi:spexin isoform X3 [Canis lupus baileyi]|uniref:spexin isoform X3 n=1 Tax=Canis lupus baileyi TaxID=143281 RepID=UPI003B970E48